MDLILSSLRVGDWPSVLLNTGQREGSCYLWNVSLARMWVAGSVHPTPLMFSTVFDQSFSRAARISILKYKTWTPSALCGTADRHSCYVVFWRSLALCIGARHWAPLFLSIQRYPASRNASLRQVVSHSIAKEMTCVTVELSCSTLGSYHGPQPCSLL
jgi:hypothetical protein